MARNGEFTALGTLLRINDTGVGDMSGRIPINYFQYAASGFPNVYSDVAGVHNMHNTMDTDRSIRHTWLLSLTAGLAVGAYPDKWTEEKRKIFKKAIDFHYALGPYLYSNAIDTYESGYPYTLTPMTIACPDDSVVMKLENFQWMIGESMLAAPLLKNHNSGKMDVYLPAGRWFDYESGERFKGPVILEDYDIPLEKTPCFVGGKGVVILRESDDEPLQARIYPSAEEAEYSFTYPDGKSRSRIRYRRWAENTNLVVRDITDNKEVPFRVLGSGSISFQIVLNHNYDVSEK